MFLISKLLKQFWFIVILLTMIMDMILVYFSHSLYISPQNLTFLKTFNSDFSYIKVWFTNKNSKPLATEDKK